MRPALVAFYLVLALIAIAAVFMLLSASISLLGQLLVALLSLMRWVSRWIGERCGFVASQKEGDARIENPIPAARDGDKAPMDRTGHGYGGGVERQESPVAPSPLSIRVVGVSPRGSPLHLLVGLQGGPTPALNAPLVYVIAAKSEEQGAAFAVRIRNGTPGNAEPFRRVMVLDSIPPSVDSWHQLTIIDVDTLYPARSGPQKYTFTCQVFRSGVDIALGLPGPIGEPLAAASAHIDLKLGEFGYQDLDDWISIREDALATFAKILSNCAVDVDWKWGCLAEWVKSQKLPAPVASFQSYAISRLLDYLSALRAPPSTSSNRSVRLGQDASIDFQRECIMVARELVEDERGTVCHQTYQSLKDSCPRAYPGWIMPAAAPLPFQRAKPSEPKVPDQGKADEKPKSSEKVKEEIPPLDGPPAGPPQPASEAPKAEESPPRPPAPPPVPAVPLPVQSEPEPTPLVPLKPFEMHHAVEPSGLYLGGQKVVLRVVGFLPGPKVAKLWVTYRLHDRTYGAPMVRVNAHQGEPRQSDELTGPCLEYLGGWRDPQVAASIELAELQSYSKGTTLLNLEVDIHVCDASGEDKRSGRRLFEFDAIMPNEGHGKARQDRDECYRAMVLLVRASARTPCGMRMVNARQEKALSRLVKEMATVVYGSPKGHLASADEILRDLNDYRPLDLAERPSLKYASEQVRKTALNKCEEVISFRPSPEGEQLLNALSKALGIPRD